jgi:ATPases with chaperone activity, ATP-binding subunit
MVAERPVLNPREIVAQGRKEARALGSSRVEAEHLLLALAARPETSAGQLLTAAGLDHGAVREALDLEFERSLGAVGIWLHGFCLPEERLPVVGGLRLAQSAKLAFERAIKLRGARHDRGFDHLHLLFGIVSAEGGTVARALAVAGVDRGALAARARALLDRAA